jgi:hypothetical protein
VGIPLPPPADTPCAGCGTPYAGQPLTGQAHDPAAWFRRDWTCRHVTTYQCGGCYRADRGGACPACGSQEEYTG